MSTENMLDLFNFTEDGNKQSDAPLDAQNREDFAGTGKETEEFFDKIMELSKEQYKDQDLESFVAMQTD